MNRYSDYSSNEAKNDVLSYFCIIRNKFQDLKKLIQLIEIDVPCTNIRDSHYAARVFVFSFFDSTWFRRDMVKFCWRRTDRTGMPTERSTRLTRSTQYMYQVHMGSNILRKTCHKKLWLKVPIRLVHSEPYIPQTAKTVLKMGFLLKDTIIGGRPHHAGVCTLINFWLHFFFTRNIHFKTSLYIVIIKTRVDVSLSKNAIIKDSNTI